MDEILKLIFEKMVIDLEQDLKGDVFKNVDNLNYDEALNVSEEYSLIKKQHYKEFLDTPYEPPQDEFYYRNSYLYCLMRTHIEEELSLCEAEADSVNTLREKKNSISPEERHSMTELFKEFLKSRPAYPEGHRKKFEDNLNYVKDLDEDPKLDTEAEAQRKYFDECMKDMVTFNNESPILEKSLSLDNQVTP